MFASKVDRQSGKPLRNAQSELGQQKKGRTAAGIKSTNPLSPTQGSQPDEEDEDDYYDEEDDGTTPGPGAYFNPQTSTTFKSRQVPERLQFFGSTVERFYKNSR